MTRRSLLTPAAAGAVLLTMLSLNQVFVRQRWLFPSLVGVGVAFLVGWAGRRLDVPGLLAPALSMLALVTLLGISFHPSTTAYGIPTGETMRAIGESLRTAGVDISELAAPAEATDALTLLATTGVFLIAVLVDVLVFRVRRPVAAGIPLLTLFLIPTSMAEKANVFAFILAAFGYLGLLVAEGRDRARAWGRRLSGVDKLDEVGDVSHVARVGRRIGTAAVGLALAIPVALPSVGDGMFEGTGTGPFGRGNGSSRVAVLSPIVQMAAQLHDKNEFELFTVRPRDGGQNGYTRLTSLDTFDGGEWTLVTQEADEDNDVGDGDPIPQPPEHGRVRVEDKAYDVEVGPLAVTWLPVPYSPHVVRVKGDWKYEPTTLSIFSARDKNVSQNVSFSVEAKIPQPTPDQLKEGGEIPPEIEERYLSLPQRPPSPVVLDTLNRVTANRDTAYDKAMALQEFFTRTGGFTYNLNVRPGTTDDLMAEFLVNKEGYCEQFAAAMAYMARLARIPARVAVGFTRGTQVAEGVWSVTNRDAHAWPELYFPTAGWVRFEPTPRGDDRTDTPSWAIPPRTTPVDPGADPSFSAGPSESPEPAPSASTAGPRGADEADEGAADDAGGAGGALSSGRARSFGLGLLGVLAVLAIPSLVGYVARRRRRVGAGDPAARTHAAWDALADAAEDAGYPLRDCDSPRASARRLVTAAGLTGVTADEVARLASAEERARYARSAPPVDGLEASAKAVRKALLDGMSRWGRVRAVVFPASSLRRIREGYGSAIEAMERSRTAVSGRLSALVRRGRPAAARIG